MGNGTVNNLAKELPGLVKGGWLPTIVNAAVIVGLGYFIWDEAGKNRIVERDISGIKDKLTIIAEKQSNYADACLKVLLHKLGSETVPPGRVRPSVGQTQP